MADFPSSRGQVFQIDVKWNVSNFGELMPESVEAMAESIRDRARDDMGGTFDRFGKRGLTTRVTDIQGGYKVGVYQKPGFLKVYEYGGESIGKPMLWVPYSADAQGIRARNYKKMRGVRLIRPKGKRILINAKDRKTAYLGVSRVTHQPRFHIRQIATEEANMFVQRIGQAAKESKDAA